MATSQQIRDAIDIRLVTLWSSIQTREAAYFASHGIYWQGIKSHTVDPADGADVAPDNLSTKPYYQSTSWADIGGFPATFPATVIIDQYNGPSGFGYVATLRVVINSNTWQKSKQFGSESYRDQNWVNLGAGG